MDGKFRTPRSSVWRKISDEALRPAIAELERSLSVMRTNEPINRRGGNVKQADLERENADSYKKAIKFLENATL